jgi:hypothetical protein
MSAHRVTERTACRVCREAPLVGFLDLPDMPLTEVGWGDGS